VLECKHRRVRIEQPRANLGTRRQPLGRSALILGLVLVSACDSKAPPTAAGPTEKPAAAPSAPAAAGAAAVSQPLRAAAPEPKPPAADLSSFAAFWPEFRAALLASNVPALERMTRFPLEVKGELDDEPIRKVDRAKFPKLLQKLLAQKSQNDERRTVREDLQQTATPEMPAPDRDNARVNEFDFERVAGQWRFVLTYLDSEVEL
jgi:hypothetical protein